MQCKVAWICLQVCEDTPIIYWNTLNLRPFGHLIHPLWSSGVEKSIADPGDIWGQILWCNCYVICTLHFGGCLRCLTRAGAPVPFRHCNLLHSLKECPISLTVDNDCHKRDGQYYSHCHQPPYDIGLHWELVVPVCSRVVVYPREQQHEPNDHGCQNGPAEAPPQPWSTMASCPA